jgi:type IX secretion system substrate protein/beta-propeller repeat-containing protein
LKNIFYFLFLLFSTGSNAQAPSWLWAKSAGGNSDDRAFSIASDNTGNLYITGRFTSPSITFGATTLFNPGMVLVKYDSNGNIIWAKGASGSNYNRGNAVATDNAGNIYVAGYFSSNTISFDTIQLTRNDTTVIWSNLFLVKYDSSGNVIWAKNATKKGSSTANAVTADNLGNIFVAGAAGSDTLVIGPDTLFPGSYYDYFVAKYDTAGNALWARGISAGGFITDVDGPFISADKYGNVCVTGGFHNPTCVIVTTVLVNQGNDNIYLAKFNGAGNLLWAKRYGASGEDNATSIATDTSGNIYITGFFTSTNITFDAFTLPGYGYVVFVVRLDPGGTAVWAKRFGRLDYPASPKIVADKNEDVYVTGYFSSPALVFTLTDSLVNEGLFLAKYDNNGNFKWARDALGGSRATGVTVDVTGNAYITGYFGSDTLIFDSTVLLNDTNFLTDIFIAAINPLTSVAEFNFNLDKNLSVFPNPSSGRFYILTNRNDQGTITIYDMIGKEIVYKIIGPGLQQIDISVQPKGIYFVTVRSGNNNYSKKIIVQ